MRKKGFLRNIYKYPTRMTWPDCDVPIFFINKTDMEIVIGILSYYYSLPTKLKAQRKQKYFI